jgi:glycerol-3-phosphate dehydrogenase
MVNMTFNRRKMLEQIETQKTWDILIIGGGATGLGAALDAASRGYSTLLLEQHDFAKGTSSRSTKLVHGGVRYLAQGNIKLVYRALHERGVLLQNAPHVVKPLSFIIPCYTRWNKLKYTAGLKFYDLLSGKHSFGRSTFLPANEVADHFPNINSNNLKGGVQYFDGQFDDARLAINIAQTAAEHNAVLLNYFQVTGLTKHEGKTNGIMGTDLQTGENYNINARSVINATGIFVDDILQMDNADKKPVVTTSQGVHIVINKYFLAVYYLPFPGMVMLLSAPLIIY